MILIGQYDSPFVRRVGIALTWYGLDFEHRPWSTFGDAEAIAAYNPLRRVPTLVLDDGMALTDSLAILEVLDDLVGPEAAVLARRGAQRRDMLRIAAFAAGAADKGVSLVYERAFREGLPMWVDRCRAQVSDTLDLLDRERAARDEWLFGDRPSHADVILATMFRFVSEALAGSFDMARWPALRGHSAKCEALPQFQAVVQPFVLAVPE